MGKEIDITGQKFNMLTAIRRVPNYKPTGVYWLCRCDCGNECVVKKYDLIHLRQISCNCFQKKSAREKHTIHGGINTKLYPIWVSMKQRCKNPNHCAYHNYGGRGITVCEEWLGKNGFENFRQWSEKSGYREGLSIDRIDNDKGYSPDNCRWATYKEQANNRRGVHKITFNGETHSPAEWSRIVGISETTIKNRLFKDHNTVEEALTTGDRRFTANGTKRRKRKNKNIDEK